MENKIFNYKFITAHKASSYPYLYSKFSQLLSGRDCYTTKHTDIVIDGFPRSANTYATYAFDIAQLKKYNIANHIHKKSQFLIANKYGIPGILLIRRPIDCISSLLFRQPKYDPAVAFEGYYFLYNGLKHLDSYVVGNFENVLNNYGEIINRLNLKFGCQFNLYIKNEENEEKVKHIIHTQDELKNAKDYKQRVAYPNKEKQAPLNEIKNLLQQKKYENLNKKCEELYLDLINKN
ncbi:MAG: hypothetical protein ACR2FN_06385 [Chitinophagaceae bacterium]